MFNYKFTVYEKNVFFDVGNNINFMLYCVFW